MSNIKVVGPTKQREWAIAAVANFILGGLGAGFCLFTSTAAMVKNPTFSLNNPLAFNLIGPVLVVIGLLCLTTEAGRPFRGHLLFRGPATSWMSRELIAFFLFVTAVFLDRYMPHIGSKVFVALASLFFITSQGLILYASRGVPAWNVPAVPIFFISSALASGAGLTLIITAFREVALSSGILSLSMALIFLNLVAWFLYLLWPGDKEFRSSNQILRHPLNMLVTTFIGHALPLLALLLVNKGVGCPDFLVAISGIAINIGIVVQKVSLVLSSGFLKKITITI